MPVVNNCHNHSALYYGVTNMRLEALRNAWKRLETVRLRESKMIWEIGNFIYFSSDCIRFVCMLRISQKIRICDTVSLYLY